MRPHLLADSCLDPRGRPLAAPLLGPGHAQEPTRRQRVTEGLCHREIRRIVGESAEVIGRDMVVDQLTQLAAHSGDVLAHVEVHQGSP